jgi:arylsulfatase
MLSAAFLVILSVACSKSQPASEGPKSLKDWNLIIINIDALRADHLGCYGYHRDTSPFIDSLAAEGVLFEHAMANSSHTSESVASLITGRLPSRSGFAGSSKGFGGGIPKAGPLFRAAGYKTGFFSNTLKLKHDYYVEGFDEVQHLPSEWGLSREGPRLSQRALKFVRECKDQKFMMYLHYLDPHGPYAPPQRLYLKFANEIFPHPVHLYYQVLSTCPDLVQDGFGPGEARFEDMVLRYDAEIAHSDESVAMLFDGLRELGVADSTLVIISADHGEEFLEHNYVDHAWTLYDESLRIPLIFWASDHLSPARISERVSVVDILPTVLRLLEIEHDANGFDGRPFFKWGDTGLQFTPPDGPYIAELLIENRSIVRTAVQGDWKYIAAQKWLTPSERAAKAVEEVKIYRREVEQLPDAGIDFWGPVVHEELYNLAVDAKEQNNVIDTSEHQSLLLKDIMTDYEELCQRLGAPPSEPTIPDEQLPPEELERLRDLGYL